MDGFKDGASCYTNTFNWISISGGDKKDFSGDYPGVLCQVLGLMGFP